jgi:hypothetical protein
VILPFLTGGRRFGAHALPSRKKPLDNSTRAGIFLTVGGIDYPRIASTLHFRTPSLGGQPGSFTPRLPAFFARETGPACGFLPRRNRAGEPFASRCVRPQHISEERGASSCVSKPSFLSRRSVQVSRPAETLSASRHCEEHQSVQLRQPQPAAVSAKAPQSVQVVTSPIARSTRGAATEPLNSSKSKPDRPREFASRGLFAVRDHACIRPVCRDANRKTKGR